MKFNNDSDSQDLVSLVADATGVNSSSDLKKITRAINRANKLVWAWIWEAYGGWQYDDSNNTDMAIATATLTTDQAQYTVPVEAKTIKGIEVKNEGNIWNALSQTTLEQIRLKQAENEFQKESGQPRFYIPMGEVFKIYPAPNYTQAASIRIFFDRGAVEFASTDNAKTPGFVSEFHEAVADGASYFIARDKRLANVQLLKQSWDEWKNPIQDFYSKRYAENFPAEIKNGDYSLEMI